MKKLLFIIPLLIWFPVKMKIVNVKVQMNLVLLLDFGRKEFGILMGLRKC